MTKGSRSDHELTISMPSQMKEDASEDSGCEYIPKGQWKSIPQLKTMEEQEQHGARQPRGPEGS